MKAGRTPRLLLLLPQLPQDPASGAARSMTSICELLAGSGWNVRALCTTLSESAQALDADAVLQLLGIDIQRRMAPEPEWLYRHRGIQYRALAMAAQPHSQTLDADSSRRLTRAFRQELASFRPDIVFTFGMRADDLERQHAALRAGARVVFGLRNEAYLGFRQWGHLSGVLTPSEYLSALYRDDAGLVSTALPAPLDPEEVRCAQRDPIFITMVNPSRRKGVDFFARLAERLSLHRPDLPFLVIESFADAGSLVTAGLHAGFDLRRHANIMISPAVPLPRDLFAPTRILLVPSLQDAGPRVIAEALFNGVPPLVSDRGGLPEMCRDAGRVLGVDDSSSSIDAWIDAIVPLMDDDACYQRESARASEAGTTYDRELLRPRYDAYFRDRLAGPRRTRMP